MRPPYHAIVTARTDFANRATLGPLLDTLNANGKPLILGPLEAGHTATTSTTNSVLVTMGLAGALAVAAAQTILNVGSPDAHEVVADFPAGNRTMFSSGNWVGGVASGQTYLGTGFMAGAAAEIDGQPVATAIEKGTARLTSGVTGGRIVIFPTYLLSGSYTADHRTMLLNAVNWAWADAARPGKTVGYKGEA